MTRRFPGIDPHIEDQHHWPGFHNSAIVYCRDAIADRLPDSYDVWIEERIQLVDYPEDVA